MVCNHQSFCQKTFEFNTQQYSRELRYCWLQLAQERVPDIVKLACALALNAMLSLFWVFGRECEHALAVYDTPFLPVIPGWPENSPSKYYSSHQYRYLPPPSARLRSPLTGPGQPLSGAAAWARAQASAASALSNFVKPGAAACFPFERPSALPLPAQQAAAPVLVGECVDECVRVTAQRPAGLWGILDGRLWKSLRGLLWKCLGDDLAEHRLQLAVEIFTIEVSKNRANLQRVTTQEVALREAGAEERVKHNRVEVKREAEEEEIHRARGVGREGYIDIRGGQGRSTGKGSGGNPQGEQNALRQLASE
eukprot:5906045-Pleurochrysis_carterae.AAC.2